MAEGDVTITLYANWKPITYTVAFDKNDENATGEMNEQTFTYDEAQKLTTNTFENDGYVFTGWNTKADGSGTFYIDEQEVLNIITTSKTINLYAIWAPSKYILEKGSNFNARIEDDNITQIIFTDIVAPSGTELKNVANDGSDSIVTWVDGITMYVSSQVAGQKIYANPDSSYLLSCYTYSRNEIINKIDVGNLDTSLVTNMSHMFANNFNLYEIIGLEGFKTNKVTDMSYMFEEDNILRNIDVSKFDTSNVTDMSYMFSGLCDEITSLDLTNFDTSNVTDMSYMFSYMRSLEELDISSFDTSKVLYMANLFIDNESLTTIYVSDGFVTTNITDNGDDMFLNCSSLEGENGTTYSETNKDIEYAHVDGGTSNPGYFTRK